MSLATKTDLACDLAIARDAVWIIVASILTAYHISDAFDMDGRKLTAESPIEYTNSILRYVRNFT